MAIDKKLIHFKTWNKFISQGVGNEANITTPTSGSEETRDAIYGQIRGTSIVFIKDVGKIWTHGRLYGENTESSGIPFERVYWSVNEDLTEEQLTNNIRVFERLCEEDKSFKVLLDETSVEVFPQTINHNDDGSISNIELLVKELSASSNESNKYLNLLFELKPDGTTIYKESYQTEFFTTTKINELLDAKQDTLVSGTNISTINGQSLLTGENIEVGSVPFKRLYLSGDTITEQQIQNNIEVFNLLCSEDLTFKCYIQDSAYELIPTTINHNDDGSYASVELIWRILWEVSSEGVEYDNVNLLLKSDGSLVVVDSLKSNTPTLEKVEEMIVNVHDAELRLLKEGSTDEDKEYNLKTLELVQQGKAVAYRFIDGGTVIYQYSDDRKFSSAIFSEDYMTTFTSSIELADDGRIASQISLPEGAFVLTTAVEFKVWLRWKAKAESVGTYRNLYVLEDSTRCWVDAYEFNETTTVLEYNCNNKRYKRTYTNETGEFVKEEISFTGSDSSVTVDSALSETSENPVQNKVITEKINTIEEAISTVAPALYINIGMAIPEENGTGTLPNLEYNFEEIKSAAEGKSSVWLVESGGISYHCAVTKSDDTGGVILRVFKLGVSTTSYTTLALLFVDGAVPVWHANKVDLQSTLISGQNIKTINNQTLLGSGNIDIEAGESGTKFYPIYSTSTSVVVSEADKLANKEAYEAAQRGEDIWCYFVNPEGKILADVVAFTDALAVAKSMFVHDSVGKVYTRLYLAMINADGSLGVDIMQEEEITPVQVIDNLETANAQAALSANQGKVLKEMIESIPSGETVTVIDNLDSDSSTAALSAKQGKALKEMIENLPGTEPGEPGVAGDVQEVAVGETKPTDQSILLWVDTSGDSDEEEEEIITVHYDNVIGKPTFATINGQRLDQGGTVPIDNTVKNSPNLISNQAVKTYVDDNIRAALDEMGAFVTDSIADNELVFAEALNVINNKIAAIEARLDAAGL